MLPIYLHFDKLRRILIVSKFPYHKGFKHDERHNPRSRHPAGSAGAENTHEALQRIEQRFDQIDTRFDKLDTKIDTKIDALVTRMHGDLWKLLGAGGGSVIVILGATAWMLAHYR